MGNSQRYKYIKNNSILCGVIDEYVLSIYEYSMLYSFFVTYSCCGTQSYKKRSFADYGWTNFSRKINDKKPNPSIYLKDALSGIIDLDDTSHFIFTDEDNLKSCFVSLNLTDGMLDDYDTERVVIARTNETSRYLKLFYRIRDGFAHGKFKLVFASNREKMVLVQDDDGHNVTARILIKLKTLLSMIKAIDKNTLIQFNDENSSAQQVIENLAVSVCSD